MTLTVPNLDDTSYETLVEWAKQHIAARSDQWTDFNPHDPGVTILELLAWLTETHIYEADQITDAHRKKYLQLLDVRPQPPQPASVSLSVSPKAGQSGRLPAGTALTVEDGSAGQLTFETTHETTITDSELTAVVVDTGQTYEQQTTANASDGMYYRVFGDSPTAGSAVVVGFDGDPFDGADTLSLFVDCHDESLPEPAVDDDSPVEFEPSVEVVWEYCHSDPADRTDGWSTLTVSRDTTNSLYESGVVDLEQPDTWEPHACESESKDCFDHSPELIWLRCRLTKPGYEIPPQWNTIQYNVVEASHRSHHEEQLEPVDEGPAGTARRTYRFEHAPVLSARVCLDGEPWTEVDDFDGAGPTDQQYVLDRQAGTLTVGDNRRGARPPATARLKATYVAGGGSDGNVPADATWSFAAGNQAFGDKKLRDIDIDIDIQPHGASTGGRDGESLDTAIERATQQRETASRAVTAVDYAEIAERTPGLRIARTEVFQPEAAETTDLTIIVVPYAPPDVRRPTPSEGFRQAVEHQLDCHRLLTDRLSVSGPTYVGLRLDVSATVQRRYDSGGEQTAIKTQLETYLDPIRGFDGDGWPFGQAVSKQELREQVRSLAAVERVELSIHTVGDAVVTADETVMIDDHALFYIENISVTTIDAERTTTA